MSMAMPLVLAMEALKLHLVAVLFFLALEAPLPWLPATLAFVSAAFLGMALRRLGSRLATRALVHLAGLALSVFAIYKAGLDPALEGFALPAFLVSSMLGGAFWIRGSWIGTRKPDHEFCLARFEEGIGVYLIVFLMASPSRIDVSTATRLSLSFFACGILSLGISKGREAATGGFSRLSPAAALVPLATGFTLASLGLFLVVPALQQGALRTRVAMKEGSSEFIRLLGLLLSKLFRLRPSSAGSAGNGGAPYQLADEGTAQASPLVNYLLIIILAVVFALVMVIIVVMLAQYFRAWASRSEGRSEPLDLSFLPAWLRALLHALDHFASRAREALADRRRKRSAAVSAYARLLACGRGAGYSRKHAETPREYARRLESAFPRAADQAGFIVGAIEEEVYGNKATDRAISARLGKAKRRLSLRSFLAERFGRAFRRAPIRMDGPGSENNGDTLA